MRKLATFYRKQAVFGGVMERDDEGRALQACIATLEKVESPFARRRIVRYLVERYVSPEEDVHALAQAGVSTVHVPQIEGRLEERRTATPLGGTTEAENLAIAKAIMRDEPIGSTPGREPLSVKLEEDREPGRLDGHNA